MGESVCLFVSVNLDDIYESGSEFVTLHVSFWIFVSVCVWVCDFESVWLSEWVGLGVSLCESECVCRFVSVCVSEWVSAEPRSKGATHYKKITPFPFRVKNMCEHLETISGIIWWLPARLCVYNWLSVSVCRSVFFYPRVCVSECECLSLSEWLIVCLSGMDYLSVCENEMECVYLSASLDDSESLSVCVCWVRLNELTVNC